LPLLPASQFTESIRRQGGSDAVGSDGQWSLLPGGSVLKAGAHYPVRKGGHGRAIVQGVGEDRLE